MASNEDLETRVTALERQVTEVRADAATAYVLARAADRDVSEFQVELRSHTRTLNALRENQLEFRETQLEHGKRLDRLEGKVDDGFTKTALGMAQITALLRTLTDDCPESTE